MSAVRFCSPAPISLYNEALISTEHQRAEGGAGAPTDAQSHGKASVKTATDYEAAGETGSQNEAGFQTVNRQLGDVRENGSE